MNDHDEISRDIQSTEHEHMTRDELLLHDEGFWHQQLDILHSDAFERI
jgi:hypothetical protein